MKYLRALAIGLTCLMGCKSESDGPSQSAHEDSPKPGAGRSELIQPATSPSTFAARRGGKKPGLVTDRPGRDSSPAADSSEDLSFDVGRVISGAVLTHTFRINNSTPEALSVKQEQDIHLDCGCSSIVPAARMLPVGAAVDVTVTVRTGGLKKKKGPFINGGTIVWTSAGGLRHATSLTLRGDAVPAFAASPQVLSFSPAEIKQGASKVLLITAAAPVDWDTWTVTCSSPYFQIVDRAKPQEGKPARCQVKCLPPESIEDFSGDILVEAQARLSESELRPVSAAVPVRARQAVDLAINPKVVPVTFLPSGEPATVKLALRGDRVAKGAVQIESIRYEGCAVTWKLSPSPDNLTLVLSVTLVLQPNSKETKPRPVDPVLLIQLAGGKSIPVPAVEVGPSLDKP
jgi:hypothetical protein